MEKNEKRLKVGSILTVLIYAAFIALFSYILSQNREALARITSIRSIGYFCIVLVLMLASMAARSLMNMTIFRVGSAEVKMLDGFKLAVMTTMGNYLPFSAGLVAKGIYLKRKFAINYSNYALISFYTLLTSIMISGFLGVLSVLIVASDSYVLIAVFFGLSMSWALFFVPIPRVPFLARRLNTAQLQEPRQYFKKILPKLILIFLAGFLIATIKLWFCFFIIGEYIQLPNILLFICGTIFTLLVTVLPGAIGIREGIIALLAHLTGVNVELSVIAVSIDRLAEVLTTFGIGFVILQRERYWLKNKGRNRLSNE